MLQAGHLVPFSIVERDGHIVVSSPYHPNFPARARGLGGEWDAVRHLWIFDAADRDRVTALCREIYGPDGEYGKGQTLRSRMRRRMAGTATSSPKPRPGRTITAIAIDCASG